MLRPRLLIHPVLPLYFVEKCASAHQYIIICTHLCPNPTDSFPHFVHDLPKRPKTGYSGEVLCQNTPITSHLGKDHVEDESVAEDAQGPNEGLIVDPS